jgi:hypothetical protein
MVNTMKNGRVVMTRAKDAARAMRGIICGLALLSSACGGDNSVDSDGSVATGGEDVGEVASALTTAAQHSLVIKHLAVVENSARTVESCRAVATDPDTKVWSLPYLLKKEAARYGITPTTYVANWLNAWNSSSTVNGQSVPVKGAPQVIAAWPKNASGQYRLEKAPFRLSAIVSRLDLRTFRPENEPIGGEVRFVFTVTDSEASACPPGAQEQMIILEYSTGRADENAVLDWAKRWYALGNLDRNSSTYLTELQKLTDETLQRGKLERLRTNEVALFETVTPGWFLTEFVPSAGGSLVRATVKQTPLDALKGANGSANLATFIAANLTNFETVFQVPQKGFMYNAGNGYRVADRFPDNSTFRGAFANVSKVSAPSYWSAPKPANIDTYSWSLARHRFSLGTCNGCHGGENPNGSLVFHVKPRFAGTETQLSPFLAGQTTLTDPVDGTQRTYNEMQRRQDDLHWLANEMPLGNPVYGNYYKMRFQHSSKCLDLEFESTAGGGLVKQYGCHGRGNQRLTWIDRGNNEFSIRFKHSGLCLDVENGSSANGAKVVQKTCSSAISSQRFTWFATSGTNSPLILTFKHSGKCLRVQNQSTSDGAQVIQDACSYVPERGLFLIE